MKATLCNVYISECVETGMYFAGIYFTVFEFYELFRNTYSIISLLSVGQRLKIQISHI